MLHGHHLAHLFDTVPGDQTLIFRARPLLNQPDLLCGAGDPVVLVRVIAECLEADFESLPRKFGLAEHHA